MCDLPTFGPITKKDWEKDRKVRFSPLSVHLLRKSKWTETYEFPHFRSIYLENRNGPKLTISPLSVHLLRKSKWTETYEFPHFRSIYLENRNGPKLTNFPTLVHLLRKLRSAEMCDFPTFGPSTKLSWRYTEQSIRQAMTHTYINQPNRIQNLVNGHRDE